VRVVFKPGLLVLIPESDAERAAAAAWRGAAGGHVFRPGGGAGAALILHDLGSSEEACREPINVGSRCAHPAGRWISNFAEAPFTLDGRDYRTVESFWQGLKFETEAERARVAQLTGPAARKAGQQQGYGPTVTYEGRAIPVGTWEHWELMRRACAAKFTQCAEAGAALLSTGDRPLEHRMRRDSQAIPGAIMAEIWMQIRQCLREGRPPE
jgi:predicted NAD-dependent protein-ADP-ribosyltransferase YbiA (DUF1768 family)